MRKRKYTNDISYPGDFNRVSAKQAITLSVLLISVVPLAMLQYNFSNSIRSVDLVAFKKEAIVSCAPARIAYSNYYFGLETIEPNDNRHPAGDLKDGVLTIHLEARKGVWYPETPVNPGMVVYAFAEEGKPLQMPGPLIRVPEGTEINLTIRNNIDGKPLILHGFHTRSGNAKDSVTLAPGAAWSTRFKTGEAGTYYYHGTLTSSPRIGPWPLEKDGQLYGGMIIDKLGEKPDTSERIFIIGRNIERLADKSELVAVAINGLSWPFTERLTCKVGELVNWRVINASSIGHPMHLHGFYYNVHSIGDGETDKQFAKKDTRRVVTQLLMIGETMRMSWVPERSGNWLFHCHMLKHIAPADVRLRPELMSASAAHDLQHHVQEDMAGLIMGLHVLPNSAIPEKKKVNNTSRRQINLLVKEYASPYDSIHSLRGMGFVLQNNKAIAETATPTMPGPAVIIHQHEPVAINVTNQSNEPTTIHWHGIELENYFDGVAGWGFQGTQVTPLIGPGQSFTAQITAPHAGTFIYHTHMHDKQLMRGMYGPLIVLKPGEEFDSATDKIIVISTVAKIAASKRSTNIRYLINGSLHPEPLRLQKGKKYRLRLINITEDGWAIQTSLLFNKEPVIWKMLAKDGNDLTPHQSVRVKASGQRIAVGETIDLEFLPQQAGEYKFEVDFDIANVFHQRIAEMVAVVE
jgi:FtsP/CotA-like multicopper oxidase with cupredoxin domain